jgi:SAM-dependent methyltransferase
LFSPNKSSEGRQYFDRYADHYYARPEFAYFKAEEGRCFREHISALCAPSLEIGYEDGRLSSYHTDNHVFDIGLEYDTALIGKSPLFANYRQIVAGSIVKMPFPDATIGSIVAIHVLDHVRDLKSSLAEMARVLKPGGLCMFSLFSQHVPDIVKSSTLASYDLHHFLDRSAWQAHLEEHGLQINVFREFTFSRRYLRIYFLGMMGLVPHDRSFLFLLVNERLPLIGRGLKEFLKRVTYAEFWRTFDKPNASVGGCNVFIVAQKIASENETERNHGAGVYENPSGHRHETILH